MTITSKEQTVTVERQGPGGREEVGLISGIFQFLSDRKESLMCHLLLLSLDLGWYLYLCETKWGKRVDMGVRSMWLRNESAKKSWGFFFFPLHSAETLFLLHLCKMFFWCSCERWKFTCAAVWKLNFVLGGSALNKLTCFLERCSEPLKLAGFPVWEQSDRHF